MNDNWIPFEQVNFADATIMQYHIDTRDFHCVTYHTQSEEVFDHATIGKYGNRFYFTADEVQAIVTRLYTESGGKNEWRFLCLTTYKQWLKYIRVYRINLGLIISDRENHALGRDTLSGKIEMSVLDAHSFGKKQ